MKIALLQMNGGIDPEANAAVIADAIAAAAAAGAVMLFTPEMSGLLDRDGDRAARSIRPESDDPVLARVRAAAAEAGIWVHLGSLALQGDGADKRLVNRGFVIDADGEIGARYDKIHLFDVDLATGESWRESARYAPGRQTAVTDTPVGKLGLSICYDIRFPGLFQALSGAGAMLLGVPAAFTVPTGQAHWHILLRARAIENAAFVIAAAQCGVHEDGRATFGHSLVVDPWGSVLLDMGTEIGLGFCDLPRDAVDAARRRVPVIAHRRPIPPLAGASMAVSA